MGDQISTGTTNGPSQTEKTHKYLDQKKNYDENNVEFNCAIKSSSAIFMLKIKGGSNHEQQETLYQEEPLQSQSVSKPLTLNVNNFTYITIHKKFSTIFNRK